MHLYHPLSECGDGGALKQPKTRYEGLYINKTQLFTNVAEGILDCCYSVYHGLQKWFKDRNGMKLSESDIQHVIRVLNVFDQSLRVHRTYSWI